jgi:hypothetical protein
MDNQRPDESTNETLEDIDELDEGEEIEVTREELVAALEEVVRELSEGLKGPDREIYLTADDLAQNDWFYAGVSDEPGVYSVTMWPAEGEEETLRIDLGSEDEVHRLAGDREAMAAMVDEFIAAMEEEYEEYDELEEEEEYEEGEEDYEEGYEEYEEDEELLEEEEASGNGRTPPRQ